MYPLYRSVTVLWGTKHLTCLIHVPPDWLSCSSSFIAAAARQKTPFLCVTFWVTQTLYEHVIRNVCKYAFTRCRKAGKCIHIKNIFYLQFVSPSWLQLSFWGNCLISLSFAPSRWVMYCSLLTGEWNSGNVFREPARSYYKNTDILPENIRGSKMTDCCISILLPPALGVGLYPETWI